MSGLIYCCVPWSPHPRSIASPPTMMYSDSTQVRLPSSLSLGRQEFHLAVQLIQYSAAHNEAAR